MNHSTLGSRVIKKKKKKDLDVDELARAGVAERDVVAVLELRAVGAPVPGLS